MPNPFVKTPNQDVQDRAVSCMNSYFQETKRLTQPRRAEMVEIYKGLSTFKQQKDRKWETSFRVNKGFVAVTKWTSRLFANRFKWMVSRRMTEDGKKIPEEDLEAIQDTLTFIFDREDVWQRLKMWGKKMVSYGIAFAQPRFEMRTVYLGKDTLMDETSERVVAERMADKGEVKEEEVTMVEEIDKESFEEEVLDEFPTIDPLSFTDVLYDPRYLFADELPAIMVNTDRVRWASITRNRRLYFNLDRVDPKAYDGMDYQSESKLEVHNIQGVQDVVTDTKIDMNSINIKRYYGVFSPTGKPEDEKLYKLTGIGNGNIIKLLIQMKQIKEVPQVGMKCFEDTETMHAFGVVEPQKGAEDELNWQKNSKSLYINAALNRNWLWSPKSGVKPSQLVSSPGNIIVCKDGVPKAKQHLEQLQMPNINSDVFASENDLERQISDMTFQIGTTSPRGERTLQTDTATGAKIGFFDTSSVINDVRKNMESAVVEMAYKMLELLFDNLGDSWVIERIGEERYFRIHRTLFQNSRAKYNIRIEPSSSTFDRVEQRRSDALAFWNLAVQAKAQGVPVNMQKAWEDIMDTFEKRSSADYIQPVLPGIEGGRGGAISKGAADQATEAAAPKPDAVKATEAVAGAI